MSLVSKLNAVESSAAVVRLEPRPIVGPGSATDAVDQSEAAEAAAEAERAAADRATALALARDNDCDRAAHAYNIVSATEFQKGRFTLSRKGAWTVARIKQLLDALFEDDAPVAYPQFQPGALGGRSALPMEQIETALASKPFAPQSGEKGAAQPTRTNASHSLGDEGQRDAADADPPSSQSPTDQGADA